MKHPIKPAAPHPLRIIYILALLLLTLFASGCAELERVVKQAQQIRQGDRLDTATVAAGLKEALKVGTERTVLSTSAMDGYLGDTLIRIAMPAELQTMSQALRKAGLGRYVDEMEVAMNRAAEQAAGEARAVFWQAISSMTLDDAYKILKGHDTAATSYFRSRTEQSLRQRYRPIVQQKMQNVGLYTSYNKAIKYYSALPFVKRPALDLDSYVTDGALNGLFTILAQEEKQIRTNPAARSTELLKRVFAEN